MNNKMMLLMNHSAHLFVAACAYDRCALVQAAHQVGVQQVTRDHLAIMHARAKRSRYGAAALVPAHLQQQQQQQQQLG
jgi:hypothetical protein